MKWTSACLILPIAVFLMGCESLSPAECATANWRDLGLQDGGRGEPDRAADYFESCSKAKVAVDVNTYRAARAEGLQSYCRPANTLSEGLAGKSYRGVCPAPLDQSFRSVHDIAWRAQDTSAALASLQRQQDQMQDARNAQRNAQAQLERMRQDMQRRGVL